MMPLRVIELFAGIGAQASALERLKIPFTSSVSDIDKRKFKGYCAIHGDTVNYGDITKIEHLPACDLLTYSPPCQDISMIGDRKGLVEGSGTRSSLFWEVLRLLKDMRERNTLPKVLVMENVDAIVNKQNRPHLDRFLIELNELGYESSWSVLNSKNFGIPQNRSRFFMVSSLDKRFIFPDGEPLKRKLCDYWEDDVPASYFISDERIETFDCHRIKRVGNKHDFYEPKKENTRKPGIK